MTSGWSSQTLLWFWGLSRSPVLSVLFYFAGINLIKLIFKKKKKHSTQRAGVTMKTPIPSYPGVLWDPGGSGPTRAVQWDCLKAGERRGGGGEGRGGGEKSETLVEKWLSERKFVVSLSVGLDLESNGSTYLMTIKAYLGFCSQAWGLLCDLKTISMWLKKK